MSPTTSAVLVGRVGWYALSLACLGGWWLMHAVYSEEAGFTHGAWSIAFLILSLRLLDRAAASGRELTL